MNNLCISVYSYPGITIPKTEEPKEITFEVIRDAVCDEFNMSFDEIASASQKRIYLEPRQIIQTLADMFTSEGQTKIAMRFKGRDGKYKDHASVIHSRTRFYEHYELELKYRATVRKILVRIGLSATYLDSKTKIYNTEKNECIIIK